MQATHYVVRRFGGGSDSEPTWHDVSGSFSILGVGWEDAGMMPLLNDDEGQLRQRIDAQLQNTTSLCQNNNYQQPLNIPVMSK